jgi:GGDEF domain-containing protein
MAVEQPNDLAREVSRAVGAVGIVSVPLERGALLGLVPTRAPFASTLQSAARAGSSTLIKPGGGDGALQLPAALLAELARQDPRHDRLISALIDPETSLFNYEFLTFKLDEEFKRARRFGQPLACVMLGFDGECDEGVLRRLASLFLDASRDTDVLGRFDRSSFLFLLPNTDPAGARAMVSRVQASIGSLGLRDVIGDPLELSIGMAHWPSEGVQQAADLYRCSKEDLSAAGRPGGSSR